MPTPDPPLPMAPASAAQPAARAAAYNATVAHRMEVAPGLMILRVVLDGPPFPFTAGQYVVLGLKTSAPRVAGTDDDPEGDPTSDGRDTLIRRAYSIASSSLSAGISTHLMSPLMSVNWSLSCSICLSRMTTFICSLSKRIHRAGASTF